MFQLSRSFFIQSRPPFHSRMFQPKFSRLNSSKQVKKKKDHITEEEVKKIAEKAKKEQMLWDALIPEKRVGFTSPIFWVLLGSVVSLHYYNGEQQEIKEEERKRELKLAQLAVERRRVAPLTSEERAAQISLKERQLVLWENKVNLAQKEASQGLKGAELRLAHAVERLEAIRASLNDLRAPSPDN